MVRRDPSPRNEPKPLRFIAPPWTVDSPQWLAIDADLPADNPVREVAAVVAEQDLSRVVASYAGVGSPAHPPEILMRIVLFEIHRGRLSPSEWVEDARHDDAVKWLAFGARPSRSCLFRFRDRVGPYIDPLLAENLGSARKEELVVGRRISLDGTFVGSYASRHRPLKAETLDQRCRQLDAAVAADQGAIVDPAPPPEPPPAWMAGTPAGRFRQRRLHHEARDWLRDRQRARDAGSGRRSHVQRLKARPLKASPTDPEAVLGIDKMKVYRPLLDIQLACDLDSGFILGYEVFSAATDVGLLEPMLAQTATLSGATPEVVLADGTYANVLDLELCEQRGVTLYAPADSKAGAKKGAAKAASSKAASGKEAGRITKAQFAWQAESRTYRCPEGHDLKLERRGAQSRSGGREVVEFQYRCPEEHCRACPLKARCTCSAQGRIIKRSEHDDLLEALRRRMASPEGRELYRLRHQTVEREFADLKKHRGLGLFTVFGLTRSRIQVGLLVLIHNGLQLLKARRLAAGGPATPAPEAA